MLLLALAALAPQSPADEATIALFNGRDLTGWHTDIPAADDDPDIEPSFVVEDGILLSRGRPQGHLITDASYQDYRLVVEWRWPGEPGNCGILVHSSTPRRLYRMFPASIECQLHVGNAGDFWCIGEDIAVPDMEARRGRRDNWGVDEGRGRRIRNLTDDSEHAHGEWNEMVIECRGRRIDVWVNGEHVNDGFDCTADRGQIAVQAEGRPCEFRRIELTPLAADFEALFSGRSLRFDYHHTGTADEEHIAVDGFRLEGEWAGSRTQLVDPNGLGKYRVRLVEPASERTLYSHGFSSIYGEWETTGAAREQWQSFQESVRLPEPRQAALIALDKRAPSGELVELFRTPYDPAGRGVDRSAITPHGALSVLFEHGPPATKVDLLVVGDGYTAEQAEKFASDAERLCGALFDTEPFRSRRSDFNVRLLHVPSFEAGISNPRQGVWRQNPMGLSFNAFDSDRYVLSLDDHALREAAAQAPYDALVFLANERKYGGGGIYNLWATCSADSGPAAYVFVHELGHSFAGLADEYYTSQVSYEEFTPAGSEPWEPNITALLDPMRLKWSRLVEADTPLPTPWSQAAYDEASYAYQERRASLRAEGAGEELMDALFQEVKATTGPMLEAEPHHGQVGAFEGAGYQAQGLYRPEVDCIMFSRNPSSFCRVCTRGIERAIERYAR